MTARLNFSKAQRLEIAERDGWRCNPEHGDGCGEPVEQNSAWQADHILPVVFKGPNTIENGQILCFECHKAKTHGTERDARHKSDRQRAGQEAHDDAMKRGERRMSKKEMRRAAMKANRPEPGAERQTTEVDG